MQYLPKFFEFFLLRVCQVAHDLRDPDGDYNEEAMEARFRALLPKVTPGEGGSPCSGVKTSWRKRTLAVSAATPAACTAQPSPPEVAAAPPSKSYKAAWTHLDRVELAKTRLAEVVEATKAGAKVHEVIAMLNKIHGDCWGMDGAAQGRVKHFCSKVGRLSLSLYGVRPHTDWRQEVAQCHEDLKDV